MYPLDLPPVQKRVLRLNRKTACLVLYSGAIATVTARLPPLHPVETRPRRSTDILDLPLQDNYFLHMVTVEICHRRLINVLPIMPPGQTRYRECRPHLPPAKPSRPRNSELLPSRPFHRAMITQVDPLTTSAIP